MARRVGITGVGVVSALGATARETWDGLLEGRIGIRPITLFDASRDRTHTAAQAAPFDEDNHPSARERRRASRGDRMGMRAALEAVGDAGLGSAAETGLDAAGDAGLDSAGKAGLGLAGIDPLRTGLVLGGGGGGLLQAEDYLRAVSGRRRPRPSVALGFFPATTADRIASRLGCRGTVTTIMNACSSATVAIGLGAGLVASGELDLVLAGGVETLSRTTFAGFNALRLVDPEPCRPFDRARRGMSLGECAAFVVLEEAEAARARGARVLAEVAGCGLSADAHHMTAPDPSGDGLARSMKAALAAAGVGPDEVDHISAHGTGTEQNDIAETRAIKTVFGERAHRIPVVSIKGMVGHCLGAAGAIEAVAAALSIHHGVLPPTAGLASPDPECDLDYVPLRARRASIRVAISNSTAFGGNNGTLVLRRHDPGERGT